MIISDTYITSQTKPRARDLGIPFEGEPATFNAITDVKGVEVGYSTRKTTSVQGSPRFFRVASAKHPAQFGRGNTISTVMVR